MAKNDFLRGSGVPHNASDLDFIRLAQPHDFPDDGLGAAHRRDCRAEYAAATTDVSADHRLYRSAVTEPRSLRQRIGPRLDAMRPVTLQDEPAPRRSP